MPTIRIATFNCENLFARYKFRANIDPPTDGFSINDLSFDLHDLRAKRITAQAVRECNADIMCLQEVDNQPVLDRFASEFLAGSAARRYRHRVLLDGNDPRHIDVAFLSRFPIKAIRSHRHDRTPNGNAPLFSRDCLRVDFEVGASTITLYGNHFKSMMGGRSATRDRRVTQAEGLRAILERDWGPELDGNFAVLGDLNDYPESDPDGTTTGLSALIDSPQLIDPMRRLPTKDRWTHYFNRGDTYRQLDYVLLSRSLDADSGGPKAGRVLKGLPWRADRYSGTRFDDVGENTPKASDHVPVFVDVQVGAREV